METLANTKDFKTIRSIDLQVGPACNMHCRHCQQMPDKKINIIKQKPSASVMQMLDNFIQFSQRPAIAAKGNAKEPACRVMFYGGEVLLYWDICKDIIEHFYRKYDLLKNYGFRFAITTNGSLLTKETVDFVNQYDIMVMFSYDAPHPFAVRDFISDEICKLVNQIKHAKILAAGSSYNCDLLTAYRCLSKKFPNAVYKPSIEINRTFCEMPADTDSYDLEKLRIGIRKLVIGAKMNDGFCLHALKNFLFAKMNPQDNFFYNTKAGICISCNRMVSVTMNGNVSFCYNTYDKLGAIETDTMESIRQKAQAVWDSIYDPACSTCEARDICYWGCARLLKDKNKHAYNCENFRKPFFRILREEVMALNNPLTKEETDWFNQQELLMEQEVKTFLQCGKNHNKGK